jgi:putative flavoprotein involved in K+ transport
LSNKIVIIGAGPYGLSIAAYLRARGTEFRIFGKPMGNWQHKMPRGMLLKSDGFASNLADPDDRYTLSAFCDHEGIAYEDEGLPVSREAFIDYGCSFQQRFVPEVEERTVVSVRRSGDGFAVQLDDGEIVVADKVIVGVGISDFGYLPASLAGLSTERLSHCSRYEDLAGFRGRTVAVIGGGSSAVDTAALLQDEGADVLLVTRRGKLRFHSPPEQSRPLAARLRAPNTGIGPGWPSVLYTQAPLLFHRLSADTRMRIVSTSHGPAGGWYMQERVVGRIPVFEGYEPRAAEIAGDKVLLRLARADGSQRVVTADHVIAATGYKIDIGAIGFIDAALRTQIAAVCGLPVLSRDFETSVAGLYVVGPASAYSFGPMFRFVLGARDTARRLARHLAGAALRRPVFQGTALAAR